MLICFLEVIIITQMRISNPLGKDVALEVTVSSAKSLDVTCRIHSGQLSAQLPWLVNLTSLVFDMDCGSVVEFWLCNLWSLVRSPVIELTVYTADET